MKRIYKYHVNSFAGQGYVNVPMGADFISAIIQNGELVIYAAVNPELNSNECLIERRVFVLGTGWDIPDDKYRLINSNTFKFLGTVTNDPFVWHIWVEK